MKPSQQYPPGYRETVNEIMSTDYGWAVINPRGDIAVVRVYDWDLAIETMPYRWLNTHPLQPTNPRETFDLAVETRKKAGWLIKEIE
jgi:hypothetical protein